MSSPVRIRITLIQVLSEPYIVAGGWRKAHPIPPDKGALGNFELLSQEKQARHSTNVGR
jgi:hypothetical protein